MESLPEISDEEFYKNEETKRLQKLGAIPEKEEEPEEKPEIPEEKDVPEEPQDESETETEPEEPKEDKKESRKKRYEQKKKTYQDRINELTSKIHRQDEEIQRLKNIELTDPPMLLDYADDEGNFDRAGYNEAQSKYDKGRFDEYRRQAKEEELARDKQAMLAEKQELFNLKAEEIKEKYEDFDTLMEQPLLMDNVVEGVLNCKEGPEVFYYLAKNDRDRAYVNSISNDPMALGMELGRIETKLSGLKKRTSNPLPKPLEPVSGDTGEAVVKELTDEEWFAKEEKKRLAKLKNRGY